MSTGVIVAVVITAVLLIGGGVAAVAEWPRRAEVRRGKVDARGARTRADTGNADALGRRPSAPGPDTRRSDEEVATGASGGREGRLEGCGRQSLGTPQRPRRLQAEAKDAKLKAGLSVFVTAIRESLRQNRECADACPASDLEKVNRLKHDTVEALNPLLRKYAKSSYRSGDI